MSIVRPLALALPLGLALTTTGCLDQLDPARAEAELEQDGIGGAADGFSMSGSRTTLSVEMRFDRGAQSFTHHLDLWHTRAGELPLRAGQSFVGGPVPHQRGRVEDYVQPDGTMEGPYLEPWVDLVVCEGSTDPIVRGECAYADRVDVSVEAIAGSDLVRIRYVGFEGTTPVARGAIVTRQATDPWRLDSGWTHRPAAPRGI